MIAYIIGDDDDTPFTSAKLSAKKEEDDEDSKDEKPGAITTNAFFSPRWYVSFHITTDHLIVAHLINA